MISNLRLIRRLQFYEVMIQSTVFLAISIIAFFGIGQIPAKHGWICFVMEIFVIIAYLLRKRIQKIQLFVGIHLIFPIVAALLGYSDNTRFSFAIAAILIAAYSIRVKMKSIHFQDNAAFLQKKREAERADMQGRIHNNQYAGEQITIFAVGIMVFGYMMGFSIGSSFVKNSQVILSVIFVLLKILYNNDTRLNDVFVNNEQKTEFPAGQILSVNRSIVIVAVVCILSGMLLFYNGEYGNIFTVLQGFGMAGVRVIVRLFIFLLGAFGGSASTQEEQESTTQATEAAEFGEEEVLTSPVAQAAAEAFAAVLIVTAIAFVIYFIVRYIRSLNKVKKSNSDIIEYIQPNTAVVRKDKIVRQVDKSEKEPMNQSVRKLYKKRVKAGVRRNEVDATMTPKELTKQTITSDEEVSNKITDIYEKARYSKEVVTKEELEYLKHEK